MGGSTSRNNQLSHRDILNRRNSGYNTNDMINQQITSLPNLLKNTNDFLTDTNGSQKPNLLSSNIALISTIEPMAKPITVKNVDSRETHDMPESQRGADEFDDKLLEEASDHSPSPALQKATTLPVEGAY